MQNSIFQKSGAKVFTIEPHQDFLDELAKVLNEELITKDKNDFGLSDAIILLPTRRAARALQSAFLNVRQEAATILPRIRTLGDIDPDDMNLIDIGVDDDLAPPIPALRRKFDLATMIRKRDMVEGWNNDVISALGAADALADLLESAELTAEGLETFDWSKLDGLVNNLELAGHWEKSTKFLEIITQIWPTHLEQIGFCDPAFKRRRAIEALAENWAKNPPKHPVIIAGSTGAIPATRRLMKVVARLDKGAVILPGLDKALDDKVWQKIGAENGHPQRTLFDTIDYIGVERHEIDFWPSNNIATDNLLWRRRILNEALTPKESTADWRKTIDAFIKEEPKAIEMGLDGLCVIEAENEDEEAQTIALEMRKTLENKGETCALVTPDLNVARRVSQKMEKWGIKLDVSSGMPIGETYLGSFLKLSSEWLSDQASPIKIMALLSHPWCNFALEPENFAKACADLEIVMLRGAQRFYDFPAIITQAKKIKEKVWDKKNANSRNVIKLLEALSQIGAPCREVFGEIDITKASNLLLEACEALGKNIWRGSDGQACANFFNDLRDNGTGFLIPNLAEAMNAIMALAQKIVVRPRDSHPNLAILGPLEARLIAFDKIILAGLDEGIWPAPPDIDPFLSRGMREELGLQAKDLRLGLSAHDFAQMAAKKEVIITRSNRRGGAPSVPSRWLWRLKTLCYGALGTKQGDEILSQGNEALGFARKLIAARDFKPELTKPMPRPPKAARPTEFSATEIETWIRDPYKSYVQKILNLRPLDPLGGEVSAKERGSAIHAGMEIIEKWYENPPQDPTADLMQAFEKFLGEFGFEGQKLKDELERLKPSAQFMGAYEIERIKNGWKPNIELWLECVIDCDGLPLKLKARADRIDKNKNGKIEIWDFKTGTPPSDKQINQLYGAQLPVTALIIKQNPPEALKNGEINGFGHVKIGGRKPKIIPWDGSKQELDDLIGNTIKALTKLRHDYDDETKPYLSKPFVHRMPKNNYDDKIDILARRAEWASVIDEAGGTNE